MTTSDSEAQATKRKNRVVIGALLGGLCLPLLYLAFLAEYLPDWLDTAVVGGIWWVCFAEVIPANTVVFLRRPQKKEPIQPRETTRGK